MAADVKINYSTRAMSAASFGAVQSSLLPPLLLRRKRKLLYIMPPTDTLPLHSTPKHPAIVSRRQLKIIGSASVCLVLLLLTLSSYTRPIYFQRVPLPTELVDATSKPHSPDPSRPLSSLGPEADQVYKLGSLSSTYYRTSLEAFIDEAFPSHLRSRLNQQLHEYLDDDSTAPPERPKIIWQTYGTYPETPEVRSWQTENPEYDYRFLDDKDIEAWITRNFNGSPIAKMWTMLPHIILVPTSILSVGVPVINQ